MRFFNRHFFIGVACGIILIIVLIPLGGYIAYQLWVKPGMETGAGLGIGLSPPPFPGASLERIDYGWSVRTLDGLKVSLSQFKGRPIYLNFWATWCAPCVAEMPSIENLYRSLENEDVVFLLVSDESQETVRAFVEKERFTFPVYLRGEDLPEVFVSAGLPTTFIADRDGTIVFRHIGAAQWDHESTVSFLRALM